MDKKDFEYGYADADQEVMVMFIPIKVLSEDIINGTALLRGKIEEFKSVALLKIQDLRSKKARVGIIQRNGQPLHVA